MALPRVMCRKNLHPLPEERDKHGKRRCLECRIDSGYSSAGSTADYTTIPLPPDEVLDGAVCGPETATLFDPADGRGAPVRNAGDADAAIAICNRCSVRKLCLADAHQWARTGVWGGVYMNINYHKRRNHNLRAVAEELEATGVDADDWLERAGTVLNAAADTEQRAALAELDVLTRLPDSDTVDTLATSA